MNISMATVPINHAFPFFILPATSFIMPPKRKESVDLATPTAPTVKRARIPAATIARAQSAATPKPLVVTKVPALESTMKNPSYSFGAPATNEKIAHTLDYCLHPGVPLHILVHPEAAKLFETVKVYSSLPLYLWI